MNFNKHSNLKDQHAFLGASKFHWLGYDEDKLLYSYENFQAMKRGTVLHDFAATCIRLNQKLLENNNTLNLYVNDAIGYKMIPEQVLYYSDNCFGTADAISFRDDLLRIHDLKTGDTPAHIEQLEIYTALFCLEYGIKPRDISIELRIYQSNEIKYHIPKEDEIMPIIDKVIFFDKLLNRVRSKEI